MLLKMAEMLVSSIHIHVSIKASKSGLYLLIISNMRSTIDLSDLIIVRIIDILKCDKETSHFEGAVLFVKPFLCSLKEEVQLLSSEELVM